MSTPSELYHARLVSGEELVAKIHPGDHLALGTWMGQPHGFMRVLTKLGTHLDPL